jgi:hypothetical protein
MTFHGRIGDMTNAGSEQASDDPMAEELRQLLDEVLYTEKSHLAAAERKQRVHFSLGVAAAVASTAAAATIVASALPIVSGGLALVGAVASALLTFMKPDSIGSQHLATGRQLAALRVKMRQTLHMDVGRLTAGEIRERIDILSDAKAEVDQSSPPTTRRDYDSASKRIKAGTFNRD